MDTTVSLPDPPFCQKASFDKICIQLAQQLALCSHCITYQVGAVVTVEGRIISTGYNGPPPSTHNCDEEWPEAGCMRDVRGGCLFALHAEQNAILHALNRKSSLAGATLYTTLAPCLACAKIIFLAGITKVIYLHSYATYKGIAYEEGIFFLQKFGVTAEQYEPSADTGRSALSKHPLCH